MIIPEFDNSKTLFSCFATTPGAAKTTHKNYAGDPLDFSQVGQGRANLALNNL